MKKQRPRFNTNGLLFACYDLLIDANRAYKKVVCKTVELYLERALGLSEGSQPLLTPKEVTLLQKVGGFTSYWDLTNAFIIYFIEMLPPVPIPTFPSKFHVPALMAYLQVAGGTLRFNLDTLGQQKNIAKLAQDVSEAGGGIDGAHKALPKENRHLLVSSGPVIKTNIVGRIFQELYLGADVFEQVYGEPAIIIQSTGYGEYESLVVNVDVLAKIGQKIPLGLVSDRSRCEVQKIDQYFQATITRDEIKAAGAKNIPDPWSLLEAASVLQPTPTLTGYVGANYPDVQAANAAKKTVPFTAIGCLAGAHNKTEMRRIFEQHRADIILGHPDNLKELILG